MIIFEGCDNSGKSTAIKQVLYRIPKLVFAQHSGGPPATADEWKERMYNQVLIPVEDTKCRVLDRFFFSEIVYGNILRGGTIIQQDDMDIIADRLYEHNPLIIYCRRPVYKIKETFSEREQLSGVYENLSRICRAYDELFSGKWRYNTYVYNFEDDNALLELVFRIVDYLESMGVEGAMKSTVNLAVTNILKNLAEVTKNEHK